MLSRIFTLSFLLLLSGLLFPATRVSTAAHDGSSLVSTSTREGRLAVFDDVWATIEERYYDRTFHGVDWQAKGVAFRPMAVEANGTQQFYEVLRQMIAPLRDAHTRVYSPEEKFDWWNPRFVTVGLSIREVEGLPTVVQVESPSAAAHAGIRPGDVLTKIDRLPAAEFIARRLRQYGSAVDDSTRFRALTTLLEGAPGTLVKLDWQTRDGKTKSATLQRSWTERHLGFQVKRSGGLAIIKIDVFTQAIASELSKTLPRILRGAKALILDLRANGGGDAEAMSDVAAFFLASGTGLGKFADRSGSSFELTTRWGSFSVISPSPKTKLPLVVLTSESTSSAAEILVAALRKERRARVIGTQTCGCVLAIRSRHALPDGGVLDVSELDFWTTGGVRLEGSGVRPDEEVIPRRVDIYSHRDAALELAKTLLKNNRPEPNDR